jgi:2-oxoglutarate dehydrogenase E2 component (dihydrolipoamide succinyltransferase)
MPQLGESVTEGTVTRWLKKEGERVEADEPLLEVSTDKVDTEIPSPVAGILRGITVAEDETVEVGAELAVIDEDGAAPSQPAAPAAEPAPAQPAAVQPEAPAAEPAAPAPAQEQPAAAPQAPAEQPQQAPDQYATQQYQQQPGYQPQYQPGYPSPPTYPPQAYISPETYPQQAGQEPTQQGYAGTYQQPGYEQPSYPPQGPPAEQAPPAQQAPPTAPAAPPAPAQEAPAAPAPAPAPEQAPAQEAPAGPAVEDAGQVLQPTAEGPYVTPLVRKLASEHGIDLATVTGTGVGGRIRKQDVLDAARSGRGTAPAPAPAATAPPQQAAPAAPAAAPAPAEVPSLATPTAPATTAPATTAPATTAPATTAPATTGPAAADGAPATNGRSAIVPSRLRGTTEQMSRARQVIAKRMVESLHVSAQLTTVVEADVTEIARLRDRAKAAFAAREGVKLSFLPFFALATVEALKIHPKLNAVIDTESNQVTYHDAEHLGIAVDTERGLMVPVIRKAGDLNIGGLARKIADLADRTRAGRVSPDDLSGGTFTLTNTGSRGALFDTPIINQPQVGILGTGTVVKRPVVVEDPALGEVITVRSMVYLALTYDHRLVDGADAARFLVTVKDRLEEGDFATELGL